MHVRQQIREAAAALLAGLTTTGSRVFQSRLRPLRESDLPCLLVSTEDESIESDNAVMGGEMTRRLSLRVRGAAKVAANLDDTLDTIAEEVETALAGTTLGGKVHLLQLQSIGTTLDDSLEKPAGLIEIEYQAVYFTTPGQPGTAL